MFILEIYFKNGTAIKFIKNIADLCHELRELDESHLEIMLIRAYRNKAYKPRLAEQKQVVVY